MKFLQLAAGFLLSLDILVSMALANQTAFQLSHDIQTHHVTQSHEIQNEHINEDGGDLKKNDSVSHDNHTDGEGQHMEGQGHGHSATIHVVEINLNHVKYPLVFSLAVIIAALTKLGFHHTDFLSTKVPESCVLILLGVILGAIILVTGLGENLTFFAPHEFFLFLLPPIILEAAFSLYDRAFFDNLGSILLFSVVGTIIACFLIAISLIGLSAVGAMEDIGCSPVQILVFSALIVAVDPVAVLAVFQEVGVNSTLYFIVFGESLLNDGVTVVLYNVMQTYNRMETIEADQVVLGIVKFFVVVLGGIFLGLLCGLFSSFLTKFTNSVKVVEPLIIFGFSYLSYILAELFHFSGIISIIVCGLVQVNYAFNNITNKSKLAVKFFAKVISTTSEIIIFLFLGLKVVTPNHVWKTGFTLWTTLLCTVFRFIIVYTMSVLINKCDNYRVRKIKFDEMFMISYGGLRGAVCFSLVALLDEREFAMKNMFVTTTLFVIFFTVFFQGGTIKWVVKKLQVSLAETSKDMILYHELNQHVSDHLMAGIEEVVGYSGKYLLREKINRLDEQFMRPFLLRNPKKCDIDEISQYYEKLVMKEHYKNLQLCGVSNLPRVASDLRAIDSSACLKDMVGDEFEQKALEQDEKAQLRRSRYRSQRSNTVGSEDLQKLFRQALVSTQNRATVKYHDRNFVNDPRRSLVGHLRNKHRKNARLSTLTSDSHHKIERALSWSDQHAELTTRRTSETKLNSRMTGRSHTVDLSPLQSGSSSGNTSPLTPMFDIDDTVFEAEEEENKEVEEVKPLLINGDGETGTKHVKFVGEEKYEISKPNTGDLTKTSPMLKKLGKASSDSHRAGQLLRQDALKEPPDFTVDIPLQDLKKDIHKQMSV